MTRIDKTATAEYHREWYAANRDRRIATNKARYDRLREWVQEYKKTLSCVRCGYDAHPAAIVFHHRDPSEKTAAVAEAVKRGWSIERILEEIAKCDVLCANCHAIEHAQ